MAQVGDAVANHRHPVGAHAEGEAGELVRVVADVFEDRGVHHSAAEQLDPPSERVRMHLSGRLGEGEVIGRESNPGVRAEDLPREVGEGSLEVGQGDVLVDRQTLHLVEHRRVRGIERVPPEHPARDDDVDRRVVLLHVASLHR